MRSKTQQRYKCSKENFSRRATADSIKETKIGQVLPELTPMEIEGYEVNEAESPMALDNGWFTLRVVCLIVLWMILTGTAVYGETQSALKSVDIVVQLDYEGNGIVTEIWNAFVNGGSEAKKTCKSLNGSELKNFKVFTETGREYKTVQPWDENKTRLDKYELCGTAKRMNGDITLHWGLGDYGERAYVLKYEIEALIRKGKDGEFLYFTFLPPGMQPVPQEVRVVVKFPEDLKVKMDAVYGYGFKGIKEVSETEIVFESGTGDYESENYMVMLLGFSGEPFQCRLSSGKYLSEIYEEAETGNGLGVVTKNITPKEVLTYATALILMGGVIWYLTDIIRIKKRMKNITNMSVKFKEKGAVSDGIASDLWSEEALYRVYVTGVQYGIISDRYTILGALLVKWIVRGNMKVVYDHCGVNSFAFLPVKEPVQEMAFEKELYEMFAEAAQGGILGPVEAERWLKSNHTAITKWLDELARSEARILQQEGLCESIRPGERIQKRLRFTEYKVTENMDLLAGNIKAMREEIKTWDATDVDEEINIRTIYAQLFNMTSTLFRNLNQNGIRSGYFGSLSEKEVNVFLMAVNGMMSLLVTRVETKEIGKRSRYV